MNQELNKHVIEATTRVTEEGKVLSAKCNDPKKVNRLVATGLAAYIGFKVLDVPTDNGVVARQYYQTNLEPTVHQLVSQVNERILIDTVKVVDLTFKVWFQRLMLVRGNVSEKQIMELLEDSPALSKEEQDNCECRVDLLF